MNVISEGERIALQEHLGALTMTAVCSVQRAKELEAENQELRRQVTVARGETQLHAATVERQAATLDQLRITVENLQDALGKIRATAPAIGKSRTRK